MLLILSIIFNSLLSSPTVWYEDSDSELESFQKIRGEKFELSQGLGHGSKISKIHENIEFGDVWDRKNTVGCCAARNV